MKKQRLYYLIAFAGLLLIVAWLTVSLRRSRQVSFKKTATGLQYQVVDRGEGMSPQEGDMLLINLDFENERGEMVFSTADADFPMVLPYSEDIMQKDGYIKEAISMVQKKGDHFIFRLSAEKLLGEKLDAMKAQYGLKKIENIRLHLQLQDIMTQESYKKWEADQVKEGTRIINAYLSEDNILAKTTDSGLCYVIDMPGQGAQPKQGDSVKVNYTGKLLDGKVFDTSLEAMAKAHEIHDPQKKYGPIEFKLGVEQAMLGVGQIRGWDEWITYLRQGAKARLFIPSVLAACGSEGIISDELILPNAILVFEVELVDVQR